MVSTILGGLKKWWCRVHRSCTELQQILQNSNVLVWTALEQMSNSTVTFPTKWRANGQTRLGLSTNQDWRNYPLSAPPNTTTTPLSFHIFGRFDWTSLKKVMVRACFFKKKRSPPRLAIWLAQSPVLFPHRLRCRPFSVPPSCRFGWPLRPNPKWRNDWRRIKSPCLWRDCCFFVLGFLEV